MRYLSALRRLKLARQTRRQQLTSKRPRKQTMKSRRSGRRDTTRSSSWSDSGSRSRMSVARLASQTSLWGSRWQAQTTISQSYYQGTCYRGTQETRVTTSRPFRKRLGLMVLHTTTILPVALSTKCGSKTSPPVSLTTLSYQVGRFH